MATDNRDPSPPGQDPLAQTFTTAAVAPDRRLQYWNDLTCQTFTGLTIDGGDEGPFSGHLDRLCLGRTALATVWSTASAIHHTAEHVRRAADDPCFLLHLQTSGASVNSQGGRDANLETGDFALCDTTRPYQLRFEADAGFIVVRLPAAALKRRLPAPEDQVSLRFAGDNGRSALLASFLQSIAREGWRASDAAWAEDIASVIADTVALGCRGAPTDQVNTMSRPLQQRVLRTLEANLGDADFGVQALAAEIGVTPRSIQKMFAARGSTPTAYLLRRRLAEAARAMEMSADNVTEVAMRCGFNDLTHFGRAFRRAYGLTPRAYRQKFRN